MNEFFLHYLWKYQLHASQAPILTDGTPIEIKSQEYTIRIQALIFLMPKLK
jgi:hypothetical protein